MNNNDSVLGLAEIRRNRGISLQQIAELTKIGVRSLEAIEQGDFRRLPGGHIQHQLHTPVCPRIDYDESILLAFYHQQTGGVKDVVPVQRPAPGSFRPVAFDFQTGNAVARAVLPAVSRIVSTFLLFCATLWSPATPPFAFPTIRAANLATLMMRAGACPRRSFPFRPSAFHAELDAALHTSVIPP